VRQSTRCTCAAAPRVRRSRRQDRPGPVRSHGASLAPSYGATTDPVSGRALEVLTRVAAIVPAPSVVLRDDEVAWAGFELLLDEAAALVADTVEALGPDGPPTLRALAGSEVAHDAICRLLLERAVTLLL
jgi:hypothetical protein